MKTENLKYLNQKLISNNMIQMSKFKQTKKRQASCILKFFLIFSFFLEFMNNLRLMEFKMIQL